AGYPVNRVKSFVGHYVVAQGATAAARRAARVAWWQAQPRLAQAIFYPQTDGRDSYVVSLNAQGAALLDEDLDKFVANLRTQPDINTDAIATFLGHGPEIKLAIDAARGGAGEAAAPPAHDLGLLFRLPYDAPELVDLRLNGHELAPDGYQRWLADGWTHVLVPVTSAQVARSNLLIVTCAYRPNRARTTGWAPPAAVLQRLR
ncbi:MAG: hypothetical protein AB7O38_13530, partial [Pirellulaceae bacterium]